jgi:Right handed beta helix region
MRSIPAPLSTASKATSLIGSIVGPSLVILAGAFFLMGYAATHAWTQGSGYADFWKAVGSYPYFVQAIWPSLASFYSTVLFTGTLLILGFGGSYITLMDFKRRKWLKGSLKLALSFLLLAGMVLSVAPSVVMAASPVSGASGASVDIGYGTPCSVSFCLFTNTISSTVYYYAMIGLGYAVPSSGCALTTCAIGAVAYGSPNNNGGATGTTLSSVMNSAIASNEKVDIGIGNFVIDAPLSYAANHVVLEGQGSASNFSLTASFSGTPLTVTGAFWLVTQVRFDARNIVTGASSHTLAFGTGSGGNNDTVSFSFFNRGDHGQISLAGIGDSAINNVITKSTDDGIILYGSYDIASGNQIYKTTNHNCISVVGPTIGNQVVGNNCKYSGSNGIAIENLSGAGFINQNLLVSGNTIVSPVVDGIIVYLQTSGVDSAHNATIISNTVSYAGGNAITLGSGSMISVKNNMILHPVVRGISLPAAVTYNGISVDGNTVIEAGSYSIDDRGTSPNIGITRNTIKLLTGQVGVYIDNAANYCVISENTIYGVGADGILFQGTASTRCSIMSNTYLSTGGTMLYVNNGGTYFSVIGNIATPAAFTGIRFDSTSGQASIIGNNVQGATNPIVITGSGGGFIVEGNQGYNPLGHLTNPFLTASNTIPDASGTGASPTNSTTTTIVGSPKFISYTLTAPESAGEVVTIQVDGTQVISAGSLPTNFHWEATLNPGQTVFFTYHTGDGTFVVSGE